MELLLLRSLAGIGAAVMGFWPDDANDAPEDRDDDTTPDDTAPDDTAPDDTSPDGGDDTGSIRGTIGDDTRDTG